MLINKQKDRIEPEFTIQDAIQDTIQDVERISAQAQQLLAVLILDMSRTQIQAKLQLKNRSHLFRAYLRPALKAQLIEMTLPDKPNSRFQRYRRTAKGEALAQHIKLRDPST